MEKDGKRHLWVTIDTEMDADVHWKKSWPPQYTSILEGIPRLFRTVWDRYDVHPIYFVSPEILYNNRCCQVLKREIECGAVIGAHLHPEYIEPDSKWGEGIKDLPAQFPNSDCDRETEFQKIKMLTLMIEQKLGISPMWYRAARFGADLDTIHSLEKLGYRFDSSVTPGINWSGKGGPDHSEAAIKCYSIALDDLYTEGLSAVREYPVTISGKRWGIIGKMLPDNWLFYRWLRPTHMTYCEMRRLVCELSEEDNLVMMFHSMEVMINKTPYVRAEWMQKYFLWRLEKILGYAKRIGFDL